MNLYAVTADGWNAGYGAEIYLVGVFSSEEKAKEAQEKNGGTITEAVLDKVYPMESENEPYLDKWSNGNYLGGYIE